MAELKTNVSNDDLKEITTPSVLYIMKTIKAVQKRMKDPDLVNLAYIQVYTQMEKEFADFADDHTRIFTKVVRGENLNTIASVLYYKDKVARGLMTEEALSELLATKYLPTHLKQEADAKMKEMKEKNMS